MKWVFESLLYRSLHTPDDESFNLDMGPSKSRVWVSLNKICMYCILHRILLHIKNSAIHTSINRSNYKSTNHLSIYPSLYPSNIIHLSISIHSSSSPTSAMTSTTPTRLLLLRPVDPLLNGFTPDVDVVSFEVVCLSYMIKSDNGEHIGWLGCVYV